MSWKRSIFSCLMWVIYLLMVGTAMLFTGRVICGVFGMAEYYEIAVPAGYLLFTGILVFVLHRMAVELGVSSRSGRKGLLWVEGIVFLVLLAAGLFLRVTSLRSASYPVPEDSAYLGLAYISTDGQGIPAFAHGAVYLYLQALRLCFLLLGNKAVAAVWLQIGLQLLGTCLLYFAVRKMAGRIPAVTALAFFMLSPYMVDRALLLSPEMLYLLGFSLVLLLVSQGVGTVFGWIFWLAAGGLAAVLCYLDVAGFLLLPLMLGVILMRRQDAKRKVVRGLSGCLTGFLLGAGGCVLADAVGSARPVSGIVSAWAELYRWGELQLSVTVPSFRILWMITLLLCFMAWGIFSFWCGRGAERFSMWILSLGAAVALQGLGMFTGEMDGFCYIFFFSTVLAGLGIRESMTVCPAGESGERTKKDKTAADARDEEQGRGNADGKEQPEAGAGRGNAGGKEQPEAGAGRGDTGGKEQPEAGACRDDTSGRAQSEADRSRSDPAAGHEAQGSREKEAKTVEKEETVKKEETTEKEEAAGKPQIEFIENPLPLPKKHEKRVMDYRLDSEKELDGYDVPVSDDDDFDH